MNIARSNVTVLGGLALAGALVITSIGVIRADEKSRTDEEARLVVEMTRTVEDAPSRRAAIDANFLSRYNSGELDYTSLPLGELPVDGAPAYSLAVAVQRSSMVVIADLEKMTFHTGQIADIPISQWSVRVQTVVKGDVQPGQLINVGVLGGPIRSTNSGKTVDSFVTYEPLSVPRRGDRLVLILEREQGSGPLVFVNSFNVYTIRDGVVVDDELSRIVDIAGKSEKEIVNLLAAAALAR